MQDLSDHPFSRENIRCESTAYVNRSDEAWFRWTEIAEKAFGHNLDGNDVKRAGCGYCLDEAYTAFCAGMTPQNYVAIVRGRPRYKGAY